MAHSPAECAAKRDEQLAKAKKQYDNRVAEVMKKYEDCIKQPEPVKPPKA